MNGNGNGNGACARTLGIGHYDDALPMSQDGTCHRCS
jgi:hypothetical protein